MTDQPAQQLNPKMITRQDRIRLLSSILGSEAVERLCSEHPDLKGSGTPTSTVDAERAAWHRNKLLQNLRQTFGVESGKNAPPKSLMNGDATDKFETPLFAPRNPDPSIDHRLAAHADTQRLNAEHPAVIARMLSTMTREHRVAALKSLPGPIARDVVQRLR